MDLLVVSLFTLMSVFCLMVWLVVGGWGWLVDEGGVAGGGVACKVA